MATAIEYGLIAALIGVAVVGGATALFENANDTFADTKEDNIKKVTAADMCNALNSAAHQKNADFMVIVSPEGNCIVSAKPATPPALALP